MLDSERKLIDMARLNGPEAEIRAILSFAPGGQELYEEIFAHYNKRQKIFVVGNKRIRVRRFIETIMVYVSIRGFESLPSKVREILKPERRDLEMSRKLVREAINGPDAYML